MADRSIGKIFVELDLDADRYSKGQKRLLKEAISTSLSIENNFRNLGIKSSAEMDLMRAKIINSYEAIRNNAKATANDIYRAEKVKNEKLKQLDILQFGERKSLFDKINQQIAAMEKNFSNIGIKSSREFNKMKDDIINSYNAIKNNATSTTRDILNAEKAKNEKLKQLNTQYFGEQKSLVNKIKSHWIAAAAAIYAAWKTLKFIANVIKDITWQSAKFETFGIVMRVVGNNAGYTGKQMEEYSKALQKNGIAMMESRRVLMMMAEAHIDLNKSQQLGRIAQNAAVIGMMNSSQAMEQMIWGIQSANLRVLRTIGINVSFERSYQKMVDVLNAMNPAVKRTVENLTELEKVTARTNEVIEFGPRIYGTYTASMETAAKQALSLQRYWDNLKILAGTIFTPVFAQIISDITGSIVDLNKDLKDNIEIMNEAGNKIRLNFIDTEISILQTIDKISKFKKEIKDLFKIGEEYDSPSSTDKIEAIFNITERVENFRKAINFLLGGHEEGLDTIYPTEEAEQYAKKLKEISDNEIKLLKDRLQNSNLISETEKKINNLYEVRKNLLFSMTEEGKKERKEKEDQAERDRLNLKKIIDAENKKAEIDRKINEANAEARAKIIKIREKENEKLRKDTEENSIKILQVGKNLFEAEKARIEKITAMYESMGLDQVMIDRWAKNEMILAADKYSQYLEKQREKEKKALEKASKHMIDVNKKTAEIMQTHMSDIFYDFMINELKTFKDYALAVMKSIARALADYYAQRATISLVNMITSAATSEQYPISEQDYYGPYSQSSMMTTSSQPTTFTPSKTDVTYNINAVDSKSFSQMVQDNPQSIGVTVERLMKNNSSLRNTLRKTA